MTIKELLSGVIDERALDYRVLIGEEEASKPPLIPFFNLTPALNLLHRHLVHGGSVLIHADVDMDGLGAAKVVREELSALGFKDIKTCINSKREHGMNPQIVSHVNSKKPSLFIVVDSSSNDLEYIKALECDVIVLDHHIVEHSEYSGKTAGGEYLIINCMIDNEADGYKADEDMSGALVAYEFFRQYEDRVDRHYLEGLKLYQWVGVTLISDIIRTGNARNQWYIERTINQTELRDELRVLMRVLNPNEKRLTRSFIAYKLVPVVNKAIRAGATAVALYVIMAHPEEAYKLEVYGKYQPKVNDIPKRVVKIENGIGIVDLGELNLAVNELGLAVNYTGLVAAMVMRKHNCSAIAYVRDTDSEGNTIFRGSFRGRAHGLPYKDIATKYSIMAQGHTNAFGIRVLPSELSRLTGALGISESAYRYKPYCTMYPIRDDLRGRHFKDLGELREGKKLLYLGIANSRLSSDEQINVTMESKNLVLTEEHTNYYKYEIDGYEVTAFERVKTEFVDIYFEYGEYLRGYVRARHDSF